MTPRLAAAPELAPIANLATFAALLPLGPGELDETLRREAAANPWLRVDTPLATSDPDAFARRAARPSLDEHCEVQLAARQLPPNVAEAAREIAGELDRDGYLRTPLAEIAKRRKLDPADVRAGHAALLAIDPPGLGARDLGERLRAQLPPAAAAERFLTEHLEELAAAGRDQFAAAHGLARDALDAALQTLRACDPDPAGAFAPSAPPIVPELIFVRRRDTWTAEIAEDAAPIPRVASAAPRRLSVEMRALRDRARLIVQTCERRTQTLNRIATAMANHQRAFLDRCGDRAALVPLLARDVGRDVGCAESTVSRAVAGRYARTPFGIVALADLLARRTNGMSLTQQQLRATVAEIATASPQSSDAAISRALALRGISLARRTVAKYRAASGNGNARERSAS